MMYVGHPKRTWDIQTNVEELKEIHINPENVCGTPIMYVVHPRCTWDIQTNIEALKEMH